MKRAFTLVLAALLWLASSSMAQNAADVFYDPAEMAAARAALKESHGAQLSSLLAVDRFEYQSNKGVREWIWDAHGWVGDDIKKLGIKTEGEYAVDNDRFNEVELQALYSQAISPFWNLQAGIRNDLKPAPSRSYLVVGAHGIAPYWFELDGAVFLSNKGDISLRLEAHYEVLFTQRAILQPRAEINAALSDDEDIGVGSGLSDIEAGLRLRYEITRQFAPYLGVSWNRSFGDDYARGKGGSQVSFVAGVRLWL